MIQETVKTMLIQHTNSKFHFPSLKIQFCTHSKMGNLQFRVTFNPCEQ
jgi:hypothetical protein